ncbi:MAG TPA: hypothetical protein DEA22_09160 [Blastocatellia bacterium]|nr:hypothetical protein [Blastocatellia bacterium]
MKKMMLSLVMGLALFAIPTAVFATCAQILTIDDGEVHQVCFLVREYTINGVEFCEYGNCELIIV